MSRIDVAIPSFNYARYLPACIESVLSQDVDDIRVHVIDNASTDDSVEVARRIAARDSRVSVLARPANLGPHASFNTGVDWASGTYMMILCADDLLAPGSLRRAAEILDRHPGAAFAYGAEVEWNAADAEPPRLPTQEHLGWSHEDGTGYLRRRCLDPMANHSMGMVLVRTDIQKRAGHYRETLRYYDDHEMMLRLANLGGVASTDAVQGIRRIHGCNMSNLYNGSRREDLEHRLEAFRSFLAIDARRRPDAVELRALSDRNFAATALLWAGSALAGGRRRECMDLLSFAASVDPSVFWRPPLGRAFRRGGRIDRLMRQFLPRPAVAPGGAALARDALS
ncbi:glycosyltransferase [Neoroseomonas oryzicola]|uniref:Glycosyltransferase n=1 Tax=Neoroseomonas oryzicola TaxID=535904 RepID=A0A9X9WHT1_9PROT|nr:glycosyltransferase [Neoroseomonas oryzicola]MBR0659891.1 glycosyltransferase [Neoroseomonas oryzicola]NKE15669.1 glycosyltransferase [Neoroseomonas oryzicola]